MKKKATPKPQKANPRVIAHSAPTRMDYDPNLVLCGRHADQRVKLTFGNWDYRAEFTVTVGGNCRGLTVIESAVGMVYDRLPVSRGKWQLAELILTRVNGDRLSCEDDADKGEEWLKDMLIGAEIISIEPEQTAA